jgi:hypothetical protein
MIRTILFTLAMASAGFAQTSADGSLTVNQEKVKLVQVYAFAATGFFDKQHDDTVVVLTDRAVTPEQARDVSALRRMAQDGKLAFVQETINAGGQIINYTVGHKAFKAIPSGGSTDHVFEGKVAGQSISGKVYTKSPGEFFGTTFEYSAEFRTPVQPKK